MKQSHNKNILKNLMRRERNFSREEKKEDLNYLILYSFLYKYLSDNLKNFLETLMPPEEDLKYFYQDDEYYEMFKEESLDNLGYFFKNYDSFIDVIVDDEYVGNYYTNLFFTNLEKSMDFKQNSNLESYFNTIFDLLGKFGRNREYVSGSHDLILREYIRFIAKLDINEIDFTFQQVYDVIASSRMVDVEITPDYLSFMLKKIISSKVKDAENVYDPFLKDASTIFGLSKEININNIYGKEESDINYFYSLIKGLVNGYSPDNISFYHQNAIQSMSIEDKTFDIIVSNIPSRFSSKYYQQSLELPASDKSNFKEDLILKLKESNLQSDENVMNAFQTLIKEVESSKSGEKIFEGEYESLNDNEFLFIINMLNTLKQDGIMAISISQNFLFKKSLKTLRKFLTYENNYIDAIISVPEELGRGVRPEVIIVFRKNKRTEDIVFIDISKIYKTTKSPNAIAGLFRRNLILTDSCLDKIVDIYIKRDKINKLSDVVSLELLKENDFNLAVSRYVDTYEGEFVRLDDLKNDKKEIDLKMNQLNKKIEKLMDDLDIKF